MGAQSWFVYSFDPAPHRRAGRRSKLRRSPVAAPPAPPPTSYVRSTSRGLGVLRRVCPGGVRIASDDHPAYRRITRSTRDVVHRVYPNPARGPGNDLRASRERVPLMAVWRNFIKHVTERRNDPTTPAMRVGLTRAPWSWTDVLAKRRFPWRISMPEGWMKIYRRRWITPAVGRNQRHDLKHAF
ncbi:MAG: hypothetical protein GY716_08030 [bacterium]|nr:hypothetical protein [bacterium]